MENITVFNTASAVAAGDYTIAVGDCAITLEATGLGASETVDLYISNASGYEIDSVDGASVQLTASNKSVRVQGPKFVYPVKAATVASVMLKRTV